jgi:hypothetical protein
VKWKKSHKAENPQTGAGRNDKMGCPRESYLLSVGMEFMELSLR